MPNLKSEPNEIKNNLDILQDTISSTLPEFLRSKEILIAYGKWVENKLTKYEKETDLEDEDYKSENKLPF